MPVSNTLGVHFCCFTHVVRQTGIAWAGLPPPTPSSHLSVWRAAKAGVPASACRQPPAAALGVNAEDLGSFLRHPSIMQVRTPSRVVAGPFVAALACPVGCSTLGDAQSEKNRMTHIAPSLPHFLSLIFVKDKGWDHLRPGIPVQLQSEDTEWEEKATPRSWCPLGTACGQPLGSVYQDMTQSTLEISLAR